MPRARGSNQVRIKNSTAGDWLKAMESAVGFLERLEDLQVIHGEKWASKMKSHYLTIVQRLVSHPPSGVQPQLVGYAKRIQAMYPKKGR